MYLLAFREHSVRRIKTSVLEYRAAQGSLCGVLNIKTSFVLTAQYIRYLNLKCSELKGAEGGVGRVPCDVTSLAAGALRDWFNPYVDTAL